LFSELYDIATGIISEDNYLATGRRAPAPAGTAGDNSVNSLKVGDPGGSEGKTVSFDEKVEGISKEPVMAVTFTNYKVLGSYAVTPDNAFEVTFVIDSYSGPSCVNPSVLPEGWRKFLREFPRSLTTANCTALNSIGTIPLWVRFGEFIVRASFFVANDLPVSIMVGTDFKDRHVKVTDSQDHIVRFIDGTVLPIVRKHSGPPVPAKPMDNPEWKDEDRSCNIRLVKNTVLVPRSQTRSACLKGKLSVESCLAPPR